MLQRRMRVVTAALPLVARPQQLYASCDVEATACLAVHKALGTAAQQGPQAAQQMLLEWLALLVARVAGTCGEGQVRGCGGEAGVSV